MKIGLLGMGTIGSGVFEIAEKLNCISVKKVLEIRFDAPYIVHTIDEITTDDEIELVVETMGGLHPAYEFAVKVLEAGKHFVTANKLLVSVYGAELTALAKENNVGFLYGAACGGGIAYLTNLYTARKTDNIISVGGILNGTTNYILDSMQSSNMSYADALAKAQELGYAERDPSSDVDGLDTQRKLVLSCAVGFDAYLTPDDIACAGIASVDSIDINYAQQSMRTLRLCAFAKITEDGKLIAYVEPTLKSIHAPEAAILSNVNYAWYLGESLGLMSYSGQGAGKLPTAANVLRDVNAIMEGARYMTRPECASRKTDNSLAVHPYYLRLPKYAAIPDGWVKTAKVKNDFALYETVPLSVSEVHAFCKDIKGAFFAGL